MAALPDDNDLHRRGELPADPFPTNENIATERAADFRKRHHVAVQMYRMLELRDRRVSGAETPIATPWPSINSAINGGLWAGQSVIVGGEPGCGKSQWLAAMAICAAYTGHPAVLVQLELDEHEMAARMIGLLAKVSWSTILYGGDLSAEASARVERVRKELATLPIYTVAASPLTWRPDDDGEGLRAQIGAVAALHPGKTPLIALDYLQIAGSAMPEHTLRERITAVARIAKDAARQAGGVLVMASAVGRENAQRVRDAATGEKSAATARNLIAVGRESGEIEYSADIVAVLCPEGDEGRRNVHVALAKVRGAGPSWVTLTFDGHQFEEPAPVRRF